MATFKDLHIENSKH